MYESVLTSAIHMVLLNSIIPREVVCMKENLVIERELEAMKKIVEVLQGLENESVQRRVLEWLQACFLNKEGDGKSSSRSLSDKRHAEVVTESTGGDCEQEGSPSVLDKPELPDFYASLQTSTEADKALAVAYWMQFCGEVDDGITAQEVNTKLKHMGHKVGNIARAFDSLKNRNPQHVVQVRKLGSTKQARRIFKVTEEGRKHLEQELVKKAM